MQCRNFAFILLMIGIQALAGCRSGDAGTGSTDGRSMTATDLDESPRHHEWVQITTRAGRTVRAYVAYPQVNKPVLSVLVIHENRGLNDWARNLADQLAEAGYVAIAPDLLSATGPDGGGTESYASRDAAREGIYSLPAEQVLDDLDAATAYVRALESTTDTVAVAGFCWGGSQAFRYAAHSPDIAAAFVFYGSAPDADTMKRIKAPVYGFYGGNDHRISAAVPNVQESMRQLGKTYAAVVYDGGGHGFMRSGEAPDAEPANKQARAQAWRRWKTLLEGL